MYRTLPVPLSGTPWIGQAADAPLSEGCGLLVLWRSVGTLKSHLNARIPVYAVLPLDTGLFNLSGNLAQRKSKVLFRLQVLDASPYVWETLRSSIRMETIPELVIEGVEESVY